MIESGSYWTAQDWQTLLFSINKKLAYAGSDLIDKFGNNKGSAQSYAYIEECSQLSSGDYLTASFIYAMQSKLIELKNIFFPYTILQGDSEFRWLDDEVFFNDVGGGFRRAVTDPQDIEISNAPNCSVGDIMGSWLFNDLERINSKIKYWGSTEAYLSAKLIGRASFTESKSNSLASAYENAIYLYNNFPVKRDQFQIGATYGGQYTETTSFYTKNSLPPERAYQVSISTGYINNSGDVKIFTSNYSYVNVKIVGAIKYLNNTAMNTAPDLEGPLDGTRVVTQTIEISLPALKQIGVSVSLILSGESMPSKIPDVLPALPVDGSCSTRTCVKTNKANFFHKIQDFIVDVS